MWYYLYSNHDIRDVLSLSDADQYQIMSKVTTVKIIELNMSESSSFSPSQKKIDLSSL